MRHTLKNGDLSLHALHEGFVQTTEIGDKITSVGTPYLLFDKEQNVYRVCVNGYDNLGKLYVSLQDARKAFRRLKRIWCNNKPLTRILRHAHVVTGITELRKELLLGILTVVIKDNKVTAKSNPYGYDVSSLILPPIAKSVAFAPAALFDAVKCRLDELRAYDLDIPVLTQLTIYGNGTCHIEKPVSV